MRHFKKIDCPISLTLLFACVLTVIVACVESSGPLGAPNVLQAGPVSSVKVSLAQPILALGQTTQATVVAKSADGHVFSGRVDFSSKNPSIATVSPTGVVTALTAGVATIQAVVASLVASAAVTVKPLAPPGSSIAVVVVALDSTSLSIGHSAKASATAMDSVGNLITGQTVTWASLSPTIATITSDGTVTAVATGSATIEGTVSGKAGSASLTVVQVPAPTDPSSTLLAFHDFNDGTPGPYAYLGTPGPVDYPNDPTNSGRGKVNRTFYTVPTTFASNDVNMELNTAHHYRYGETIWFKGDVYFPSTLSDGVTLKDTSQNNDTRKFLDYFPGASKGARLILGRQFGRIIEWMVCQRELDGTYACDIRHGNTGIMLSDDTWYTIEVRWTLNSADRVSDGVLEIYVNNSTSTPNYSVTTGLTPVTESDGGTYFNSFRFGTQLTNSTTSGAYSEYRYWDNVGFSTTRIGQ